MQRPSFLIALSILMAVSANARAQVDLGDFVSELARHRMPHRYVEQSLGALQSIDFVNLPENVEAVYRRFSNTIELRRELQDPVTGRLKAFALLRDDEVGTILHELFHCYFSRISRPQEDDFFRYWQQQANDLYDDHGEDYHEEAYAAFLTEVATRYLNQRRMMQTRTPEVRERHRKNATLIAMYQNTFTQFYSGYYRDWLGNFVTSDINLPETDRQNILIRLLDRELSADFQVAFAESKFKK